MIGAGAHRMAFVGKFFRAAAASLMIVSTACLASARAAASEDELWDAELGADAGLPAGRIESAAALQLGQAAPMVLAEGADYLAVEEFDISGVMLGMPFSDIQTLFFKTKTLYSPRKRNSIVYTVASDWRHNLDYECRQRGVIAPQKLETCVLTLARRRGLLYPAELHMVRESTGETVSVYFTSNATENSVWKVEYQNDVNELEGAAEKFANQREKKILAFWDGVLDKYGAPNDADGDKWISSDNSFDPTMTAYYGRLELTDLGLAGRDAAINVKQSKENFKPKPYAF